MKPLRRRLTPLLVLPLALACDPVTEPVIVSTVSIGHGPLHIVVGGTAQLSATIRDAKGAVVAGHPADWSSSDPAVATVTADGLVTALAPGFATVRAEAGGKVANRALVASLGPCQHTMAQGTLEPGHPVSGALNATSCTLQGVRSQGWTLELTDTTGIRIAMTGNAYAGYLVLTDSNLNLILTPYWQPAGLTLAGELPPGSYVVWAQYHADTGSAAYQLAAEVVQFCRADTTAETLSMDQTRSATLGAAACLLPGLLVRAQGHPVAITGEAGIRIQVASAGFDPFLVLTDQDLEPLAWGHGYEGTATLLATPGEGAYIAWVFATPYQTTAAGYQITASAFEVCGPGSTVGDLALGATLHGTLDDSACVLPYVMVPAQGYGLTVEGETGVRILASAEDTDPYLVLTDLLMEPVAWGYGYDGTAALTASLEEGTYIAWILASPVETGSIDYEISAEEFVVCGPVTTTAIAPGAALTGALGSESCALVQAHGGNAAGYLIELDEPTGLRIDLTTGAFDPVLFLSTPDMELVAWADGDGPGNTATIRRRLAPGTYLLWVTGWDPGATGAFELAVTEVDIPLCPIVGDIAPGQTRSGTLASSDCRRDDHWYSDTWRLTVGSAATLRIDLTSSAFDTFLILEDQHGTLIDLDDDGGAGFNSRLTRSFQPGEYRVVVTSYAPGEAGAYQLAVQTVAGLRAAVAAPEPEDGAGAWVKRPVR